ncbi:VanZ family protein [Catenibacillus scindens]|uniref:VanZ family protein n=1 Tax=Catenibacillus scindens TaxID=673271 RepID=UPI00162029B2
MIVNFAFSSAIEILQFILKKGLFEFDDIFHNTLGGIIGWAVVVLILRIKLRKA